MVEADVMNVVEEGRQQYCGQYRIVQTVLIYGYHSHHRGGDAFIHWLSSLLQVQNIPPTTFLHGYC
jgi:hypothetical protein